jgi:hypothetical protein
LNRFKTNDPTAVRPKDVHFLEDSIPNGGSVASIHRSSKAEDWVEQNYDTPLLKSIRTVGVGGPMATMMSPDTPALAIFGSILDDRVLEIAKTLCDASKLAVMVRPVADNPLVRFAQERGNMDPEAGPHGVSGDHDESDEESLPNSDSEDTDTESEDDDTNPPQSETGMWRPRGGALHQHGNINLEDLDYITPAGIMRPDGSHHTRVRLHLQLRENSRYRVTVSSKSAVCIFHLCIPPRSNSHAVHIPDPKK